jgi:hypothetical protein
MDYLTPAYSPVSDRGRLTALDEVYWARKVQARMPQISGPNLQENHIIETYEEEGCAVSTQEPAARRKWDKCSNLRIIRILTASRKIEKNKKRGVENDA